MAARLPKSAVWFILRIVYENLSRIMTKIPLVAICWNLSPTILGSCHIHGGTLRTVPFFIEKVQLHTRFLLCVYATIDIIKFLSSFGEWIRVFLPMSDCLTVRRAIIYLGSVGRGERLTSDKGGKFADGKAGV